MVDTLRPLRVSAGAERVDVPDYWKSWQVPKRSEA
jgi:hypothetical protein